jgi:hypothetical protein
MGESMNLSELDDRLVRFRDRYLKMKAIPANGILDLEFLKIIGDLEKEDWPLEAGT